MSTFNNKPILVTGSHRSGTTWVGKIINKSKKIGYINEPLSLWQHPGVLYPRPKYWFQYISKENESKYYSGMKNTLSFRYNVNQEIEIIKTLEDILRFIKNYLFFNYCRYTNKIPLVKDPMAIFSAEWLFNKFNFDVIILIRHPAAFVGSLKRVGWTHPFSHFLKQTNLIDDYLYKYKKQIIECTNNKKNIIDQGILLWNMIYSTVIKYKNDHPEWIFIKHEDISREPIKYFNYIFNKLDLQYDKNVIKKIKKYSGNKNENETKSVNDIKINSESNIYGWEKRLNYKEIEKIKNNTYDVWHHFYNENDW